MGMKNRWIALYVENQVGVLACLLYTSDAADE